MRNPEEFCDMFVRMPPPARAFEKCHDFSQGLGVAFCNYTFVAM